MYLETTITFVRPQLISPYNKELHRFHFCTPVAVWCIERQIEEERPVLIFFDKAQRLGKPDVGTVTLKFF